MEITLEYLEAKLEELNKLLQNRNEIIGQYTEALNKAQTERIQIMGQIQRTNEDIEYRKKEE